MRVSEWLTLEHSDIYINTLTRVDSSQEGLAGTRTLTGFAARSVPQDAWIGTFSESLHSTIALLILSRFGETLIKRPFGDYIISALINHAYKETMMACGIEKSHNNFSTD